MVTQWESEEAFQAWASGPAVEAHAGQRANPVATGASLLEFEVVLDVRGQERSDLGDRARGDRRSSASRVRRRATGLRRCRRARRRPGLRLRPPGPPAGRGRLRRATSTPTPRRACGPSRPWTCSTPTGRSAPSGCAHWPPPTWSTTSRGTMDRLWWDRPDHRHRHRHRRGPGDAARAHSYGVAQDIELRTNDAGLVDRFEVTLQPPDDQELGRHRHGADQVRRPLLVSGVQGHRRQVHDDRGHQPRRFAAAGLDLQALRAACRCRCGHRGHA